MNPAGVSPGAQRRLIDAINELNGIGDERLDDPELRTRIAQYELASRMQLSIPGLADFSDEPEHIRRMYGTEGLDGSFASNCLMARRLAERGVRFIQLDHRGWDHHGDLVRYMGTCCRLRDGPSAALVRDLKARGMLVDTLVIWGGRVRPDPHVPGEGAGRRS